MLKAELLRHGFVFFSSQQYGAQAVEFTVRDSSGGARWEIDGADKQREEQHNAQEAETTSVQGLALPKCFSDFSCPLWKYSVAAPKLRSARPPRHS